VKAPEAIRRGVGGLLGSGPEDNRVTARSMLSLGRSVKEGGHLATDPALRSKVTKNARLVDESAEDDLSPPGESLRP